MTGKWSETQRLRILMKINILRYCVAAGVRLCMCVNVSLGFAVNAGFFFDEVYVYHSAMRLMKANSGELCCVNLLFSHFVVVALSSNTPIDLCAFLVKCFDSKWSSFFMIHLQCVHCQTVFSIQVRS